MHWICNEHGKDKEFTQNFDEKPLAKQPPEEEKGEEEDNGNTKSKSKRYKSCGMEVDGTDTR
jgi:hypothetical protein